jgi:hypothetical protein
MTQPSVAFITGGAVPGERLEAALLEQAERFVLLGRRNLVVIADTFRDLERVAIPAITSLLRRAAELNAELTCVAHDERVVALLRAQPTLNSMRIIQRVDQIRTAA